MTLGETDTGLQLKLTDEDGFTANVTIDCTKELAKDAVRAKETTLKQLSKLGATAFEISEISINTAQTYFLPASVLNELRRKAIDALQDKRIEKFHPKDKMLVQNNIPYFTSEIDGRVNVVNKKSEAFYRRHGVTTIERGPDQPGVEFKDGFPLMTTKYCLRYELGQCLMHKNNKTVSPDFAGDLFLQNNGRTFKMTFDCKQCEMQIHKT